MPAIPTLPNTWRRIRVTGEWGVAVHADSRANPGATVTVTNRAGETQDVVLGAFDSYWTDRDGNARRTYRIDRRIVASAPAAALTADYPLEPPVGTHVTDFGHVTERIYRVTRPRNRSYLAVYRMSTDARTRTGRARWLYCGRAASVNRSFHLSAATLITEDQARAIGARLGFYANCGRALTADVSVDRGIGPVCFRRIREYRALLGQAVEHPTISYATTGVVAQYCPREYDWCRNTDGPNGWTCTAVRGHAGPHVAHYSDGSRCNVTPWPNDETYMHRLNRISDADMAARQERIDAQRAADRAEREAALAEQRRIAAEEEAELDDDNQDPADNLPACAYGPDGRMTDEWFDATMSMDAEELAAFIARVAS